MLFFRKKKIINEILELSEKWLRLYCEIREEDYDEHKSVLFSKDDLNTAFTKKELINYYETMKKRVRVLTIELEKKRALM